jgi:hypothetical protein
LVPGPSFEEGKPTKGQKGGKSSGKGKDKSAGKSKDKGKNKNKALDSREVGKGSTAKDRGDLEDLEPVEKDYVIRKKMKNLRGMLSRNIRDHPDLLSQALATLPADDMEMDEDPTRARSPSHYRSPRSASPPPSRSPSRTRARSRSKGPEAGTVVATATKTMTPEEEEEIQELEFMKMVRPWASLTVPSATPFTDAKEATRVAYGYSNALIHMGSTGTVTREKLIAMGTSMLNMATQ